MAKSVAKLYKTKITIKDVIKFEANVKGGVQVRRVNPKIPSEIALEHFPLREYDSEEPRGAGLGKRPSLRQLASIGLVTLKALEPLYEALKKKWFQYDLI